MADKVIKRSFGLLSKFAHDGQIIAPKTATSHFRKTLALISDKIE